MGKMQIMCDKGDVKVEWNPDNSSEVEFAEKAFKEHKKKGGLAFRMWNDGKRGEIMEKFDKFAEKIILAPAIQGG